MLNIVTIVGRIIEIEDSENYTTIKVGINRTYKNEETGKYDVDFIKCKINGKMSDNVKEYLSVGDLIGIRGRLESEGENIKLVADKISFLSSKKEGENNE